MRGSAPKSQPTVDTWHQPWSEPVRPHKSEDVDKIRRDERHQTKADRAEHARAAKSRATSNQEAAVRAAIAAEMAANGATLPSQHPYKDAEAIRSGVNARLAKRGMQPVLVDVIARRLKPRSSRARKK
jgi:hypothetical protein